MGRNQFFFNILIKSVVKILQQENMLKMDKIQPSNLFNILLFPCAAFPYIFTGESAFDTFYVFFPHTGVPANANLLVQGESQVTGNLNPFHPATCTTCVAATDNNRPWHGVPCAFDAWRRFCGATSCTCKKGGMCSEGSSINMLLAITFERAKLKKAYLRPQASISNLHYFVAFP